MRSEGDHRRGRRPGPLVAVVFLLASLVGAWLGFVLAYDDCWNGGGVVERVLVTGLLGGPVGLVVLVSAGSALAIRRNADAPAIGPLLPRPGWIDVILVAVALAVVGVAAVRWYAGFVIGRAAGAGCVIGTVPGPISTGAVLVATAGVAVGAGFWLQGASDRRAFGAGQSA